VHIHLVQVQPEVRLAFTLWRQKLREFVGTLEHTSLGLLLPLPDFINTDPIEGRHSVIVRCDGSWFLSSLLIAESDRPIVSKSFYENDDKGRLPSRTDTGRAVQLVFNGGAIIVDDTKELIVTGWKKVDGKEMGGHRQF
jgi:hypothetical protein